VDVDLPTDPHGGAPQVETKLCGTLVKPPRSVCCTGFSGFAVAFEAIALTVHFQIVDIVGQSIGKRAGEEFGAKASDPFDEQHVGRHDGWSALNAP